LFAECNTSELHVVNLLEINDTDMEPERNRRRHNTRNWKLYCVLRRQNSYTMIKITPNLLFVYKRQIYQIAESNRIEIFLARIGML